MKRIFAALMSIALAGCSHVQQVQVPLAPGIQADSTLGVAYAESLSVLSNAVVFFYMTNDAGKLEPEGTGFLVGIPSKTKPNVNYTYLVTARHMVDGSWTGCPLQANRLVLRFNKAYPGQGPVTLELGEPATVNYSLSGRVWQFASDDMIDLAFTLLPEATLTNLGAVVAPMKLNNLATKPEADALRVGDEIVSAGLLVGASGNWRNYPIFKWGHVSGVRGEPLMIPSRCNGVPNGRPDQFMSEVMLSASLVPGNSGSPIVFLPNALHPGRTFIAGVQSVSFIGSDVAGMAPIRAMIDKLRSTKDQSDLDLGPPDVPAVIPENR